MNVNAVWINLLNKIIAEGSTVVPRGKRTLELLQETIVIDMKDSVITIPERKMNHRFMAANAFWICSGDDSVAGIEPYNRHIAQFSDDGKTFFGAYGPRIVQQMGHVVDALVKDQNTRQATLTTWRPNPIHTKDVPCTVAMDFKIRGGELNCHVFMRSSDAWLGVPYDLFDFSMVAAHVGHYLGQCGVDIKLGRLFLTAASSHLYEENFDAAHQIVQAYMLDAVGNGDMAGRQIPMADSLIPTGFWKQNHPTGSLRLLRETKKGDPQRWWEAQPSI